MRLMRQQGCGSCAVNKVKVKICGLRRTQDVEYVNTLLPDFAGFVFASSKRQVTAAQAAQLKALLAPQVKAVGVFVNAKADCIAQLAQAGTIDLIQLHGDESAAYCQGLRQLTDLPIIRAVRVKDAATVAAANAYPADYLLFDTYTPGQYGGTGRRFDAALLEKCGVSKPYFIAGGLDADCVADVIKNTKAFAVDVSGGVETDGFKDEKKIAAFIAKVRRTIKN